MRWNAGGAAFEITDQACAIRSMRHSALVCEPSGVPSSKNARLYHWPSHASRCSAPRQPRAAFSQRCARAPSPRLRASGA